MSTISEHNINNNEWWALTYRRARQSKNLPKGDDGTRFWIPTFHFRAIYLKHEQTKNRKTSAEDNQKEGIKSSLLFPDDYQVKW